MNETLYKIVLPIGHEKEAEEILGLMKELKNKALIRKDMTGSQFFEECFVIGYNEYLKKPYYYDY